MIWGDAIRAAATARNTPWPVHEVGRGADFFPPEAGRLLKAGSRRSSPNSIHLHSNGRDTNARTRNRVQVPSEGLPADGEAVAQPRSRQRRRHLHQAERKPTSSSTPTRCCRSTRRSRRSSRTCTRRARACASRRSGAYNIQTLTCAGYDHNWVRGYDYADDDAPLLPKGTILHIIGYMDNSPSNKNVPDPRNWQGSGNRSVANMFIDLGQGVALSDEQFQAEMAKRRQSTQGATSSSAARCATAVRSRRHQQPVSDQRRRVDAIRTAGRLVVHRRVACLSRRLVSPARRPVVLERPAVWPAFEGWERNADGSFNFVFGYMNDNWEEELDVPIGPENNIRAGRSRSRASRRISCRAATGSCSGCACPRTSATRKWSGR